MTGIARKVKTTIYGDEYTIVGDTNEEYILFLSKTVDQKMRELSNAFPNFSKQRLAVLAAINLADELSQLKEIGINNSSQNMEEKAKKLISMLDEGLIGEIY